MLKIYAKALKYFLGVYLLAALVGSYPAQGAVFLGKTTLQESGPGAINLVFYGDGYNTANYVLQYANYVSNLMRFREFIPYNQYQSYFNIYRLDIVSNVGEPIPPEALATVPLGFNIFIQIKEASHPDKESYAFLYGNKVSIYAQNTSAYDHPTLAHELGHALGRLGDEYGNLRMFCNSGYTGPEVAYPNLTINTDRNTLKWKHWLGLFGVDLFEGGGGCDTGIYRPTSDSLMRSVSSVATFNAPSIEDLVTGFNGRIGTLTTFSPASPFQLNLPRTVATFSIGSIPPNIKPQGANLQVRWYVKNYDGARGLPVPGATSSTFNFDVNSLAPGQIVIIEPEVIDPDINDYVRNGDMVLPGFQAWWKVSASGPVTTISGFWPGSGAAGKFIFVFGSNFVPNATQVTVNGINALVQVIDSSTLVFMVPAGNVNGPISVSTTNGGTATSSTSFGVPLTGLNVTGFWPAEGPIGKFVHVFGSGFVSNATQVNLNGVSALVQGVDQNMLIFIVPSGAATGPINVTTSAGSIGSNRNFTVK